MFTKQVELFSLEKYGVIESPNIMDKYAVVADVQDKKVEERNTFCKDNFLVFVNRKKPFLQDKCDWESCKCFLVDYFSSQMKNISIFYRKSFAYYCKVFNNL